jgi:hypothetical protein
MDKDGLDADFDLGEPADETPISGSASRSNALVAKQDATSKKLDDIISRLEGAVDVTFFPEGEADLRQVLKDAALRLAEALADRCPRHGELGHNGPPLDDEGNPLPADFVNELKEATREIIGETGKAAPDLLVVAGAASRLQALKTWLRPRANLAADEFAKKLGSSAAIATAAGFSIACASLMTPLRDAIIASIHWLTTILQAV